MNKVKNNDQERTEQFRTGALAETFLFHCQYEKNLSEKTLKAYKTDLDQFTSYLKDNRFTDDIMKIDKIAIRSYLKSISEKNKPKTIKRKMATLKAFFNHLEFEDTISINPFRKIRISIKEGKQLPRTVDIATISKLFNHIYERINTARKEGSYEYKIVVRDVAILELLFSTGIRVSELCNLKTDDVNLPEKTLRILAKGNKERIIPICTSEALQAIEKHFKNFRNVIEKNNFLFINRLNKRFSEQSVRFMIKKYLSEINIKMNITPHMFRHSLATLLLENEVDIRYIQHLLGHASISTTQIYLHVNQRSQRKIITENHPRKKIDVL